MNDPRRPDQIERLVVDALARILRIPAEEVRPDRELQADLGLDSMSMIHVNIALEEQLGTALAGYEVPEDQLRTVKDLVRYVTVRYEQAFSSQEAAS